jgi:hypothetical protein
MWIRFLALLALLLALWTLFRFAMGLRYAKVEREVARRDEEARGRRVVAEIPDREGLTLFLEDHAGFYWGADEARKSEILGARLTLNGGVMAACARPGFALVEPSTPAEAEGEAWQVAIHMTDGRRRVVDCGKLREGVSREIATRAFEAVRRAIAESSGRTT